MVLSNIRIPLENGDVGLILAAYECKIHEVVEIKLSPEHIECGWFSSDEAANLLTIKYPLEFTTKIKQR